MEKVFLLKGLDCPNCAAKIEKEVGALNGVHSSLVNLMKQTLMINVDASAAATVAKQIETIVHSHEPEVVVSEYVAETAPSESAKSVKDDEDDSKKMTIRLITGAVIFAVGMILSEFVKVSVPVQLAFLVAAYMILGGDVVMKAVKNITKGRVFDENFLMSVSTVGAFIIGEYPEAVAVMLFYQVVKRSRKSIAELMDIRPDAATVNRNGELTVISPETVAVGEVIIVKSGEKIPLDGIVLEGESMLDTKALT